MGTEESVVTTCTSKYDVLDRVSCVCVRRWLMLQPSGRNYMGGTKDDSNVTNTTWMSRRTVVL